MNKTKQFFSVIIIISLVQPLKSEAQIYNLSVAQKSGKTIISWVNPNPDIRQLVVQRSKDSLQGFRSIVSMPDPTAYTNGYVDKSADSAVYYYRLFAAYPGGRYFFSDSKKTTPEQIQQMLVSSETSMKESIPVKKIAQDSKRESVIKKESNQRKQQPLVTLQETSSNSKSRSGTTAVLTVKTDSASILITPPTTLPTRERNIERISAIPTSFVKIEKNNRMEKPFITDSSILNLYEPSGFIYANKDGNLVIVLPEPTRKHFTLKVSREDGTTVFVMRNIKESELLIDRSNFFHSGWFNYELSESGKVREKNKFFIPAQIK